MLAAAQGGACRELRLWGPRCVLCVLAAVASTCTPAAALASARRCLLIACDAADEHVSPPVLYACRIHPSHFPRGLTSVKLDLWRYEGADVRALAGLPHLQRLTFHFLPVGLCLLRTVLEQCMQCAAFLLTSTYCLLARWEQ